MTVSRRRFLDCVGSGAVSIVAFGFSDDAFAQRRKPNSAQERNSRKQKEPRSSRPRGNMKTFNRRAGSVRTTNRVGRRDGRTVSSGTKIVRGSVANRNRRVAHPNKHRPQPQTKTRKQAHKKLQESLAKQKSGAKLTRTERAVLKRGVTSSRFHERTSQDYAIGRAHKEYTKDLRSMPVGRRMVVDVPFSRPVGYIYNTRSKNTREGKTARVVFARDKNGVFVKTTYVR